MNVTLKLDAFSWEWVNYPERRMEGRMENGCVCVCRGWKIWDREVVRMALSNGLGGISGLAIGRRWEAERRDSAVAQQR